MIGSRAIKLIKFAGLTSSQSKIRINLQQVRHSGGEWQYRTMSTPPKWASRWATGLAVVTWWWFYWNLYHNWQHLIGWYGGKPLPDPRSWTDEELGIPPDNVQL